MNFPKSFRVTDSMFNLQWLEASGIKNYQWNLSTSKHRGMARHQMWSVCQKTKRKPKAILLVRVIKFGIHVTHPNLQKKKSVEAMAQNLQKVGHFESKQSLSLFTFMMYLRELLLELLT